MLNHEGLSWHSKKSLMPASTLLSMTTFRADPAVVQVIPAIRENGIEKVSIRHAQVRAPSAPLQSTSPLRTAKRTSSFTLCTFSFSMMRPRCASTVNTLIFSDTATSLFVFPSAIACSTSRSRLVS